MAFLSRTPRPPLSDLVRQVWDWEATPQSDQLERLLPVAHANLIVNLAEDESRLYDEAFHCQRYRGATLEGARHVSSIIDTREQVAVMGVVFHPAGAAALFRERMDLLTNRCINLEDLVGPLDAGRLREQLLEAGSARCRLQRLLDWLQRRQRPSPATDAVTHVLEALRREPDVAALVRCARDTGLSPRTLRERFRQCVGLSPKRYLRLQRFHRLLASIKTAGERDWADLAVTCGYFDQAHLAHEFREFSGFTPTELVRRGVWSRHLAVNTDPPTAPRRRGE